jgi:murein L,D-transpeptidase YcbB/YkuD
MYIRDALKTLQKVGDVPLNTLRGNHEYDKAMEVVEAKLDELKDSAYPHRVSTYMRVNSTQDIKQALMKYGPVLVSMPWAANYKLKNGVYTVEGNTSSESGVVANGGGVFKKKYKLNYTRIYGYGRPNYDAETNTSPTINEKVDYSYVPTVKEWQLAAIADGYKFPKYGADGEWGAECEGVAAKAIVKKRLTYTDKNLTKIIQKVVGVEADGQFGNDTKNAVLRYQSWNGLEADGEVGPMTWKKMLKG